ncbi:MAG: 16S rRNA (guanine(966)-N(2))-methyltransferase RsmD [Clostridiales bacterium]|nr:16S rRNA (guanine(966)-N(2))-methyltransferase RsmD [Clostridiales bacterium]
MRIIAGNYKGRVLGAPSGSGIRPTADKVKGAVFSMIGEILEGCVAVDLFSGTGSLGIEALSRGARICYFGDVSPESVALTKSNIGICGAGSRSVVIAGDFEKTLMKIPERADLVFLDPPYKKGLMESCLNLICRQGILSEGGIVVCEHEGGEDLPDAVAGLQKLKEKKYGRTLISLYG